MIRRLKQFYKDMCIGQKIVAVFMVCFIAFMAVLLAALNIILYKSNVKKVEQNIQNECRMINLQISNLYDNLNTCLNSAIQGVNQVYMESETEELDKISFVSVKNNISSALNYYKSCFYGIDSLLFVDVNGNAVGAGISHLPDERTLQDLIEKIPSKGPVKRVMFPVEQRKYFGGSKEEGILTQGKRIINIDTGENIGYLFVNVKTGAIKELFPKETEKAYEKTYYILDCDNRVVVTEEEGPKLFSEADVTFSENETIQNKSGFVTAYKNNAFSWTLVNEIPVSVMRRDGYFLTVVIIVIGFLCTILASITMRKCSRIIAAPIESLTNTALEVAKGDFSVRCSVDRKDEVGQLSETFNSMVKKVSNLMEQIKKEQKQKREAELALLQIQIKPHFLYNTLDLIYVCCEMNDGEVGGRIAKALADYYRTCLSGGDEVVAIETELQNIENYLFIQKERYSDVINYQIEDFGECGRYKIPKMTLQPLVENAIYHGIKEKDEKGCITIRTIKEKDRVILEVEDDGIGMSSIEFEKILEKQDERGKKHFGLKNVHERLKLYFGEEYGLSLKKEVKTGTCIQITIPKLEAYYD